VVAKQLVFIETTEKLQGVSKMWYN